MLFRKQGVVTWGAGLVPQFASVFDANLGSHMPTRPPSYGPKKRAGTLRLRSGQAPGHGPLTAKTRPPTLAGLEVHFTPEQEAQLSQIASHAGTDTERLVKDAALRLLEQDARFRAAVREGIAQADRGEFIEEEEMEARIERMLNS
jgi:predicted transcriptional regulator